jgi:spore maturation protein CgeB
MGNRMPDREARFWSYFAEAARRAPEKRFVLGGEGWGEHAPLPPNVRYIGHVPTYRHAAVNCSATFVLNINRAAMAAYGFSPPTRIFEAAACACCVITDAWDGIEHFFEPGREILVAHSADDIVRYLADVPPARARTIGQAARRRVEREHAYPRRAELLERHLTSWLRASA